jgi:hypothetical protein
MRVIAGNAVIQQRDVEPAQMLAQQGAVGIPIPGELEQERTVVTAMCDVKDSAFSAQSISPRHARKPTQ